MDSDSDDPPDYRKSRILNAVVEGILADIGPENLNQSIRPALQPVLSPQRDAMDPQAFSCSEWKVQDLSQEPELLRPLLALNQRTSKVEYEQQLMEWSATMLSNVNSGHNKQPRRDSATECRIAHFANSEVNKYRDHLQGSIPWYVNMFAFLQCLIIFFNAPDDQAQEQFEELLAAIIAFTKCVHTCPNCNTSPIISRFQVTREVKALDDLIWKLMTYGVLGEAVMHVSRTSFLKALWHTTALLTLAPKLSEEYTRDQCNPPAAPQPEGLLYRSNALETSTFHTVAWGRTATRLNFHARAATELLDFGYRQILQSAYTGSV